MRRRFMNDNNMYNKLSVGDIVYDKENTPIGIVAYKISNKMGVMALNRVTQISAFGTNTRIAGVSSRVYEGTGELHDDIHLMPQDDFNGPDNTNIVVDTVGDSVVYAARYCKEYKLGGYDWYLPSVSEIREIWMNKDLINKSLNKLRIQNWEIRQFQEYKDIELIVSSTYVEYTNNLHCIRLNQDGKIGYWKCSPDKSKEMYPGSYPTYFSAYPFFRIN